MNETTKICKCPNLKCKRHGNCAECAKHHGSKNMYCVDKKYNFSRTLLNTVFWKNKKKIEAGE